MKTSTRTIIISSKVLKDKLSEINLDETSIRDVLVGENTLQINSCNGKAVKANCDCVKDYTVSNCISVNIPQGGRRWDWEKIFVNSISEQPIVLRISEKNIRISVDY